MPKPRSRRVGVRRVCVIVLDMADDMDGDDQIEAVDAITGAVEGMAIQEEKITEVLFFKSFS